VSGWTACARRIVWAPCFRKAEVLDLPLLDQVLHRPRHVLDRHVRVNAVLIKQIDGIDMESFARGFSNLSSCALAGYPADSTALRPRKQV
jgi:hypothetical protein